MVRKRAFPPAQNINGTRAICKRWLGKYRRLPDAIVVEGPLAGGHLGFKEEELSDPAFALERLVTEVIAAVKPFAAEGQRPIPVIAAGGIYTGADIYKFIRLGAAGVQMATRFVTTDECDAAPAFKQAYINARKEDLVIASTPKTWSFPG
ncbi:NAD(P)H-dependent flavin oxidoreductase [Thermodesulfitimonas sp.]